MCENKLKLNSGETEFIVSNSTDRYKWYYFPVIILENCLSPTDVTRNLGVFLMKNLVSLIKSVL